MSTRIALPVSMVVLLSSFDFSASLRARRDYARKNSFSSFCRNSGETRVSKPGIGNPPSAAMVGRELRHHAIQARDVVLQPRRYHSALHEIFLVDGDVGRLHSCNPAFLIRIAAGERRFVEDVAIDFGDHAFHRRNKFVRFAARMNRHQLLALTHPTVLGKDIDAIGSCQ